jgi:hypothetical protein
VLRAVERKDVGGWTLGEVVARMVELGRPIRWPTAVANPSTALHYERCGLWR